MEPQPSSRKDDSFRLHRAQWGNGLKFLTVTQPTQDCVLLLTCALAFEPHPNVPRRWRDLYISGEKMERLESIIYLGNGLFSTRARHFISVQHDLEVQDFFCSAEQK